MINVYLTCASASRLSTNGLRLPRARFIEYYRDLYQLENKELDDVTFTMGNQADFASLGRSVLDTCHIDGDIEGVDMLVCSMWGHEFDPDYSSSGPYFSNRYKVPYVFDVCDQGSITPFLSLKILMAYMKSGQSKKAILLGMEQNCIPRNLKDNVVMPSMTGAGALFFSLVPNIVAGKSIRVVFADVVSEHEVLQHHFDATSIISDKCFELGIDANEVSLVMKKNSMLWKVHCKLQYEKKVQSLHHTMSEYTNDIGILPFFYYMLSLFNDKESSSRFVAILDEDVESLSTGIVICEVIENAN